MKGSALGGLNNYRDTPKDRSKGQFILQNSAPVLKAMLLSSNKDIDLLDSIQLSRDEYIKFKNKYLSVANQLINRKFDTLQYTTNTVIINQWVDEILKTVNISKEFSGAFLYSYMIAKGALYASEAHTIPLSGTVELSEYINTSDYRNTMYVYNSEQGQSILIKGIDYVVVDTGSSLVVEFDTTKFSIGTPVVFNLYKTPQPAYIPSTPSKLGLYGVSVPCIVDDFTYSTPAKVIIGHDGSRTLAFGDYRDNLLLELEIRIYNDILEKFKYDNSIIPVGLESVKPGYFRQTRYSWSEFIKISQPLFIQWATKNKANYRVNEWYTAKDSTLSENLWKLYNYRFAFDTSGNPINLPGNWKGIYTYCYDTTRPNTCPWEMLGFSTKPVWWDDQYGPGVLNSNNEISWPNIPAYSAMWNDISAGIIRKGMRAVYDVKSGTALPQLQWARPGLDAIHPVDSLGNIRSVIDIFNIAVTGNQSSPFDGFDHDWEFGDGAPVEQAWLNSSVYPYCVQEILFLTRPGPYAELMWDTFDTMFSPGYSTVAGNEVLHYRNRQYVQGNTLPRQGDQHHWMRPKNLYQVVHGEKTDDSIQIRYGYQQWISDKIAYDGKDISTVFGQKIRALNVNLGNKLAGFTNKNTVKTYIESSNPTTSRNSLSIPSTNFDVILYKGSPVKKYTYSGVIIRALENGKFAVYGYDVNSSVFTIAERSNQRSIEVSVGGVPAPFRYFTPGETYKTGEIVRYNSVYYLSTVTQVATKIDNTYKKLPALPTVGGVSVSYKPDSTGKLLSVPYGAELRSPQEVFDLLIGWGDYLESEGWMFNGVNPDTNLPNTWYESARQFLFWVSNSWAPDASIQLSPLANKAGVKVSKGYPDTIERLLNNSYSMLDKFGMAISPTDVSVDRDGQTISVEPINLSVGGIFYMQVNSSETEHVILFDNRTDFNDVIYSPLFRSRQSRIRFDGFRSNSWYGKKEAPGYIIQNDILIPNYDTVVSDIRYYYDTNTTIDNPGIEELGRHLIGYERKDYLDNMGVSDDIQYLFYKGAMRQKGTVQAFDKLFRSTEIQTDDTISVYEEWALKNTDFGNTVNRVDLEFVLQPEENTSESIVARLNSVPSQIGFVKEVKILNAETIYTKPPVLEIDDPDTTIVGYKKARAFAILNSSGKIARVDITDQGYGYTTAPNVSIIDNGIPNVVDKMYTVWAGHIEHDTEIDGVVDIDIDKKDLWVAVPPEPAVSMKFPVSDSTVIKMPTAGYVHFDDVNFYTFNISTMRSAWGTTPFNPVKGNTVWVASGMNEDWGVYKLVDISLTLTEWKVITDDNNNLLLLVDQTDAILPQWFNNSTTDFGNVVVLQQYSNNVIINGNNLICSVIPYMSTDYESPGTYVDPDTLVEYKAYYLEDTAGVQLTGDDVAEYESLTTILAFKTLRWSGNDLINTLPVDRPAYLETNDKIWIDQYNTNWAVFNVDESGWFENGNTTFSLHRVFSKLTNTSLFGGATIYERNDRSVARLPVYDPVKGILPALAEQNISIISMRDPAKYNVSSDPQLFSNNINYAEQEVGTLWWDTSTIRYVYYEQPQALSGAESPTQNLAYRRSHWGKLFPGSEVCIYEWTSSDVPPEKYTGSGIPKYIDSYVKNSYINKFTNEVVTKYYFWVKNPSIKPTVKARTAAALDVALLLQNPISRGFSFYAPVHQTEKNCSYLFYNIRHLAVYNNNVVHIEYRITDNDAEKHTQWVLLREGDSSSVIPETFWNKMVDSLCTYTQPQDPDTGFKGVKLPANAPWGDNSNLSTIVLPVPDPMLGKNEMCGVKYRPRQSMFIDPVQARKIFVQSANSLLATIPVRDDIPDWNTGVESENFWEYTNWYKPGYENSVPTTVYRTLQDAMPDVVQGKLSTNDIVQINRGTADGSRFVLYSVNDNGGVFTLSEIGIEKGTVKLKDSLYTDINRYNSAIELRQLIHAMKNKIMINDNIVDHNLLFFSILNYVVSEQKNVDWLFKTSYIYIKESGVELRKDATYNTTQTDNIIEYIQDTKPYHTQIRDFTTVYKTSDLADGTVQDFIKTNISLSFGPTVGDNESNGHWDAPCEMTTGATAFPWENYSWDMCSPNTAIFDSGSFVSSNDLYISNTLYNKITTTYTPSLAGYSSLYPYVFTISTEYTDPLPVDIVGIYDDTKLLTYGRDYYVVYNLDNTYTAYVFNEPAGQVYAELILDGGPMLSTKFATNRNEIAYGTATDNIVINVDTKLPVTLINGEITPVSLGWDSIWDALPSGIAEIIADLGGSTEVQWDAPAGVVTTLDDTISFRLSTGMPADIVRNANAYAGILVNELLAPTAETENTDYMIVNVNTDILPEPGTPNTALWVDGERIEYNMKHLISPNTWKLSALRRGTKDTAISDHYPMSYSLSGSVQTKVWIERNNIMPVWSNNSSTPTTSFIWYRNTPQSEFLRNSPGNALE